MTTLPQRDKRLRRLAVHTSAYEKYSRRSTSASFSIQLSKAPGLRSLLVFPFTDVSESNVAFVRSICKHFPLLRVFEYGGFGVRGNFLSEIGSLIHLKYLSLANTLIRELPSSIVKLQCLQTLDLRTKGVSISIPNVLWKLKELRNLYLQAKNFGFKMKGGGALLLRGLQRLQTLEVIDLEKVRLEGLSELSLRRVRAVCRRNKAALYPFLCSKSMKSFSLELNVQIMKEEPLILSRCKSMYELNVCADSLQDDSFGRPMCLEMFPISLVRLRFKRLHLHPGPLSILEKLPNLVHLEFIECECGTNNTCSAGGFPELEYLELVLLTDFGKWEVEEGALPKLKTLKICLWHSGKVELPSTLPSSVNVVY